MARSPARKVARFVEKPSLDKAREFLARADEVRRVTSDWGAPRIAAHSAEALALLGDVEKATVVAAELTRDDPRQYTGRSAASLSAGLAQRGDFAGAMARLDGLKNDKDFDTTWWRTTGYLDLARRSSFTETQRRQAIEAARRSADGIAGFKRGEALIDVGREFSRQGAADAAREALTVAESIIAPLPATQPDKAVLMSQLATVWGTVGDRTRARKLLKRAESEAPSAPVIDRPAGLARIGGAFWTLGDREASSKLFDRAFTDAGGLVNARPRALAVVEICRSLGRDAVVVGPEFQARLDSLFAGLRDPW